MVKVVLGMLAGCMVTSAVWLSALDGRGRGQTEFHHSRWVANDLESQEVLIEVNDTTYRIPANIARALAQDLSTSADEIEGFKSAGVTYLGTTEDQGGGVYLLVSGRHMFLPRTDVQMMGADLANDLE